MIKNLILLIWGLIPTIFYSQNIDELNAASAGNIYYATNKCAYVSEYLTEPNNRYVLFVKTKISESEKDYQYVYFQDKGEIIGLLNMVVRSIDKQKDITHKTDNGEFTIINITKNISKIKIGGLTFSMDKKTANEIINQFSKQ
jgi:hypothetical protein